MKKLYGNIKHYRPSEIFYLELPDDYYEDVFRFNIRDTDIIIDDVVNGGNNE